MVTWICCPVQDSNVKIQKKLWEIFIPNVVIRVKSSRVKEYYVYERLSSFKKYVTWQGRKWQKMIRKSDFHPHFFFNSVYPSKYCLVSFSNVTVGRNLWCAGSYWQVFFGNSCSWFLRTYWEIPYVTFVKPSENTSIEFMFSSLQPS